MNFGRWRVAIQDLDKIRRENPKNIWVVKLMIQAEQIRLLCVRASRDGVHPRRGRDDLGTQSVSQACSVRESFGLPAQRLLVADGHASRPQRIAEVVGKRQCTVEDLEGLM